VSGPLRTISKDESQFDKTTTDAATPLFDDLLGIIQDTKAWCEESVSSLVRLFEFSFWQNGTWSDELVDKACELFLVTEIVDELKLVKTSFTMDFTFLLKRAPAARAKVGENAIQTLRLWLATESAAEQDILRLTKDKPIADRQTVASCFLSRIREAIETHLYLRPEMFNAYVRTLVFFAWYVRPQTLDAETTLFLIRLAGSLGLAVPFVGQRQRQIGAGSEVVDFGLLLAPDIFVEKIRARGIVRDGLRNPVAVLEGGDGDGVRVSGLIAQDAKWTGSGFAKALGCTELPILRMVAAEPASPTGVAALWHNGRPVVEIGVIGSVPPGGLVNLFPRPL
jgi:hypothetical protein